MILIGHLASLQIEIIAKDIEMADLFRAEYCKDHINNKNNIARNPYLTPYIRKINPNNIQSYYGFRWNGLAHYFFQKAYGCKFNQCIRPYDQNDPFFLSKTGAVTYDKDKKKLYVLMSPCKYSYVRGYVFDDIDEDITKAIRVGGIVCPPNDMKIEEDERIEWLFRAKEDPEVHHPYFEPSSKQYF